MLVVHRAISCKVIHRPTSHALPSWCGRLSREDKAMGTLLQEIEEYQERPSYLQRKVIMVKAKSEANSKGISWKEYADMPALLDSIHHLI